MTEGFSEDHDRLWPGIGSELIERRPPVYNAEDYVLCLKKYCKVTGLQLYLNGDQINNNNNNKKSKKYKSEEKDGRSGPFSALQQSSAFDGEMGLKQFGSVSELLAKLKMDLHLSYPSFLKEYIGDPNDGVTLLLDVLKVIQLSQTNISGVSNSQLESKVNHAIFKRALADEYETLLCLKLCSRTEDGAMKLVGHPSGLFTVAVCVMSNFSKSRVLSLQLLTRLCDIPNGHKQVSDAISMLRLRFGEPVRFKFLIGMLNSYNSGAFQISCLRFLNKFVETARDAREKIHIQSELEEAGYDIQPLKKLLSQVGTRSDLLKEELNRWTRNYIDVNQMVKEQTQADQERDVLKSELRLVLERCKALETEMKRTVTDRDEALTMCDRLRRQLAEENNIDRWGNMGPQAQEGEEVNSDQDSGKHSDNSLMQSQDERWAPGALQNAGSSLNGHSLETVLVNDDNILPLSICLDKSHCSNEDESESGVSSGSPGSQSRSQEGEQREMTSVRNTRRDLSMSSTPTLDTDSDKSSYSEKQEKEESREVGSNKDMGLMDITSGFVTIQSLTASSDTETYAERDAMQEETVMVETERITVDRFRQRYGLETQQTRAQSNASISRNKIITSTSQTTSHLSSSLGMDQGKKLVVSGGGKNSENDNKESNGLPKGIPSETVPAVSVVVAKQPCNDRQTRGLQPSNSSAKNGRRRENDNKNMSAQRSPSSIRSLVMMAEKDPKDYRSIQNKPLPPSPKSQHEPKKLDSYPNPSPATSRIRERSVPLPTTPNEEGDILPIRRAPKPPARRRPRSTPAGPRPKSTPPPNRYNNDRQRRYLYEDRRKGVIQLPDLSDGETSDADMSILSRETFPEGYPSGSSNYGTLETVSARSFGFIRPSQKLRESEFVTRLKRHKSFFNPDSIRSKKNSLLRRAESFHHSRSLGDFDMLTEDSPPRERGRDRYRSGSVERLLATEDYYREKTQNKPIQKSKSMEFLKAKILRKSSTKRASSKPSPHPQVPPRMMGRSMSELRPTTQFSSYAHLNSRDQQSSPHQPISKQESRPSSRARDIQARNRENSRRNSSYQEENLYDWRQDTPFWKAKRDRNKRDNAVSWGVNNDQGPPDWVPPPPRPRTAHAPDHPQQLPFWPPHHTQNRPQELNLGRTKLASNFYAGYPNVLNQAVNSFYLPGHNDGHVHHVHEGHIHQIPPPDTHTHGQGYTKTNPLSEELDQRLQITELEDQPLIPSPDYTDYSQLPSPSESSINTVINVNVKERNILDLPSGLY